jgi:hypothetical protein
MRLHSLNGKLDFRPHFLDSRTLRAVRGVVRVKPGGTAMPMDDISWRPGLFAAGIPEQVVPIHQTGTAIMHHLVPCWSRTRLQFGRAEVRGWWRWFPHHGGSCHVVDMLLTSILGYLLLWLLWEPAWLLLFVDTGFASCLIQCADGRTSGVGTGRHKSERRFHCRQSTKATSRSRRSRPSLDSSWGI